MCHSLGAQLCMEGTICWRYGYGFRGILHIAYLILTWCVPDLAIMHVARYIACTST